MAWTPPITPKHDNLGEIPGIRQISDEERERMNANEHFGHNSMARTMEERRKSILNSIMIEYGQAAVDVGAFIHEWRDDEEASTQLDVLSPNLHNDIGLRIITQANTIDVDIAYDIICRCELIPTMFFFGINVDASGSPYVYIVGKDEWELNETMSDSDILTRVAPPFLKPVTNSHYIAVDSSMTASDMRRQMINNGFTQKHEVAF